MKELIVPGGRREGRTLKQTLEWMRELQQLVDRPEEMLCSQEFFNSLSEEQKKGVPLHGIGLLPVELCSMLTGKRAIVRFQSGKMLYLTDNPEAPKATPEQLAKFLQSPPPPDPLLGGLLDLFESRHADEMIGRSWRKPIE